MEDNDVCLYNNFPDFLPEIVSKCVHPIHMAMITVVLPEITAVIVGLLPWYALLQLLE